MRKKFKKGHGAAVALIMAFVMVLSAVLPVENAYADSAYMDSDSSYGIESNLAQSLDSTENAGMIMTDKSVKKDGTTTFSIGANAQKVIGKTSEPTDTVILLDVSQGMLSTEKDSQTGQVVYKIQSELEAANQTIEQLMSANPKNRVSVVAYSGKRLYMDSENYDPNNNQVVELLPLAHYEKGENKDYLSLEFLNVKENGVSFDPVKKPEGIVQSHALQKDDVQVTSVKAYLGGMLNLQYGLSKGMEVLVKATDTKVNGHAIQPNVLLFMGSLPQESCADPQWWNPTLDQNSNVQHFNRNTNDAAHTVKAILVGAYQKKQIKKHYGVKANLLVSQNHIRTEDAQAFTSEDWRTVSMSGIPLQNFVKEYESKTSCKIPAGLQNNKTGAEYTLDQHPDAADDITADDIFNYVDASFYYGAQEFKQSTILEETSKVVKDMITDVEVPLEKDSFVTYTDPIGEYMNIVPYNPNSEGTGMNINLVADNGTKVNIVFTNETTREDGTIEYTTPLVKDNIKLDTLYHTVYGTNYAEELKKISVRLLNKNGKKTLVAKIPATLIPMGMSTVSYDENGKLESMKRTKAESAKPFKLIYQVKVDKSIHESNPDKLIGGKVKADYINQNANADGSKVYFYSTYKGENAKVEFAPSLTNHYYYFQEDTPVYTDQECKTPATVIDSNKSYYYQEEYFNGAKTFNSVKEVKGSDLPSGGVIPKGTMKPWNISAQSLKKNNMLPSDIKVYDYVNKLSLKKDGKTLENTMGNIAVYKLAKPDKLKEIVINYEDKDLFKYVKADT